MWQSLRVPFLTILFALLSLFVFTKLFGPIPFTVNSINTNKESMFTVSATSDATAVPDTAMVSFGVTKNAPTVDAAKEQVNTVINQITSDLKELRVEEKDIKTTNFSVNPEYDFPDGRQTPRGFTVSANMEVRLESIDTANRAIDAATRAGANQVGGVQFVLDEEDREELEAKAREEAIQKAKKKADTIAKAAGIKLGRIIDVQESGSGDVPPVYRTMALDAKVENPEQTELNPGENKVVVTVSLSYETF